MSWLLLEHIVYFNSLYVPPNDYCMDKRLLIQVLSPDERAKHAYYSQRHQDEVCCFRGYNTELIFD